MAIGSNTGRYTDIDRRNRTKTVVNGYISTYYVINNSVHPYTPVLRYISTFTIPYRLPLRNSFAVSIMKEADGVEYDKTRLIDLSLGIDTAGDSDNGRLYKSRIGPVQHRIDCVIVNVI